MQQIWIGTGHVGNVKELETSKDGKTEFLRFSLAINERKFGETEETEWVNCTVFNGLARTCAEYLKPGKLIQVLGKVKPRWYPGKQQIFATLDCAVNDVRFLPSGTNGHAAGEPTDDETETPAQTESTPEAAIPNFTEPPKAGKRSRKVEAFTAF